MNKKNRHASLLTICIILFNVSGCTSLNTENTSATICTDDHTEFTLENAKSAFYSNNDNETKKSREDIISESPFIWESGNIIPIWKAAEYHYIKDGSEECFTIPIITSKQYYATYEYSKDIKPTKCRQDLIISRRKTSGRTTYNIVFYIPMDRAKQDHDSKHFSGLLVYTNLNGKFKKVEQYEDGNLTGGVYFGEKESKIAKERHLFLINQIMEGISVFNVESSNITSRSNPTDTVEFNDTLMGSYCIGERYPNLWWASPEFGFYNEETKRWEFYQDSTDIECTPWDNSSENSGGGGSPTDIGSSVENNNNLSSETSNRPRPKDLIEAIGNDDYYSQRFEDYKNRFQDKADYNIYYISYGKKYYEAFKRTSERMSLNGRKWVDDTAINLKTMMEILLKSNPYIESNPSELYKAAFRSHPDAYLNAGFLNLCMSDKLMILMTIELPDLFSKEGISQVLIITWQQLAYYHNNPDIAAKDAKYIANNFCNIFEDICRYLVNNISTRSSVENNISEIDILELLLGEQINYFYDNIPGFAIPDNPYYQL